MKFLIILIAFFDFGNVKENHPKIDYNVEKVIPFIVSDFFKTELCKKGDVFSISYEDINEDIFFVNIISNSENKFPFSYIKTFEENKLPNRFMMYENKFFYWDNVNYGGNPAILEYFITNNMIHDIDKDPAWDWSTDDKKKGAIYFICKKNSKNFKRIITNKGIIETPKMKCE
jgi:hypothetical protein